MINKAKPEEPKYPAPPLSFFACPNSECADFNRFNAGNLSVCKHMGKAKAIRRLYGPHPGSP